MKPRSREINIFNLSMMDVISGAMGAFLILVIVLARYYQSNPANSPSVESMREELARTAERLHKIEELIKSNSDVDVEKLLKLLHEAEADLAAAQERLLDLEDRLDQASAQISRLTDEKAQLEKENTELRLHRAYLVNANIDCPLNVELYVEDNARSIAEGTGMPPFDPSINQTPYWTDDYKIDVKRGPGNEVWLVSKLNSGIEHKVFIRFEPQGDIWQDCKVGVIVFGRTEAETVIFPDVVVGPKKRWALAGIYVDDENGAHTAKQLTEEARAAIEQDVPRRAEEYRRTQQKGDTK